MSDLNVYLKNDSGDTLLPASDWNTLLNRPNNLVTTGMMPRTTNWMTDGIRWANGAYDWDHGTNGANTCYRYIDFGSFKVVEVNINFAFNKVLPKGQEVEAFLWPDVIRPDTHIQHWLPAAQKSTYFDSWYGPAGHGIWAYYGYAGNEQSDGLPANWQLQGHEMYITTA